VGITVENVSKQFGSFTALDRIDLEIKTGSLVALLGPSGSGKSTLLRIIAGLEKPDSGRVFVLGKDATNDSVQDRRMGFVFQHYALFKHMTIRKNVAFGLEINQWPAARIKHRVNELLDLVQLSGLGDRYPSQLSGGQRQRVALARALAVQPQVLLLDEPFGALDAKVRKELRQWLRQLHSEVQVTTVFVTHDQEEAMEVSDEVVVMNKGRIEQVGTPAGIYDFPASPFVMGFIGPVNVLPANSGILPQIKGEVETVPVFLRPNDISIQHQSSEGAVSARIDRIIHLGWEIQVELLLSSGQAVTAHLSREDFDQLQLEPRQIVYVKPKQVKTFPDYALT
jgi:sulfate/thiosulfate transport system ATP-binding protein